MLGLLRYLGSECWGNHDWLYKTNPRGLWLECRRCGHESAGVELPTPRYRRTQDGADEAHRLGGMAPALRSAARAAASAETPVGVTGTPSSRNRRFGERRAVSRPATSRVSATGLWDATSSSSAVAATDEERRWLQAWRALSPEERLIAERMVAGLSLTRRFASPATDVREPATETRRVG